MKLLNWAKEKISKLGKILGDAQFGVAPRFNKLAPIPAASSRGQRSAERKRRRFTRWLNMNVGHGCPVLTGERLRKTLACCHQTESK